MDEISAYAAYGIDKIIKKLPKKAGVKKPSKLPYGTIFHHKKNLKLKQMQEAKSLKSADEKVKVNRAPIKGVIKPKSKIVNGGVAKQTISKKKVNVIRSLIQEALNRKTKTVNGGVVKQTKAKNPAKNPIMSDESFSSDSEEESFSGDCEEESSGQDGTEYTLDEGSTSCSCSSVSSPESSPAAAAAAIPPASRRKTNKLNNGDLNNNNNKKNDKSPAVKQSTTQPKEKEAEPPKKTQRKSMAAPSCPLLRIPKEATTVKSSPLTNKSAAEKRKSCPLPTKMAASTAAAAAAKSPTTVKQEPNVIKEKAKDVDVVMDSVEKGTSTLSWLIYPLKIDDFFTQYWENKACQVRRKRLNYHADLVSFKMIDEMLIDNHLEFSTNIDLTTYKNGKRDTLKVPGRAMPPIVWGHYGEGCSVRILNPSTYLPKLRQVCTDLQEYFHCLVGANIYLTPPNSQGFAPHYDDIEAFVLQVEGRKRWRLYVPPSPNDVLARTSSGNLKQQQLGTLIFDEVLEPGDLLYFPRGTVHQAVTEQKQHSLHITLSVYQQQSYANLVETLMPIVLENAIKNNLNLRHGLPLNTWSNLGLVNSDKKTPERTELLKKTKSLVADYLMPTTSQIDNAIDQLATRFQHEALPPYISASDKKRTIFGSRNKTDKQGNSLCDYELSGQTKIRLLRKNIMRLVNQENCLRLYFYVDNALEYCKYEANFMEIVESEADAIKLLINSYPKYVSINKLPLQNVEQCIETATGMWERGLLMTEEPFPKT